MNVVRTLWQQGQPILVVKGSLGHVAWQLQQVIASTAPGSSCWQPCGEVIRMACGGRAHARSHR